MALHPGTLESYLVQKLRKVPSWDCGEPPLRDCGRHMHIDARRQGGKCKTRAIDQMEARSNGIDTMLVPRKLRP